MGWQEQVKRIFDFRLIEPDFDGEAELRRILGYKTFVPRNAHGTEQKETEGLLPPDEVTQKMIDYLMNGKKED